MAEPNRVFQETYQNYLKQIKSLDLTVIAPALGLIPQGDAVMIPFLDKAYLFSEHGFHTVSGQSAPYDVCIVLCRYLLSCPETAPRGSEWASFKDFKDSGPLLVYFSNEVEMKLCKRFAGRKDALIKAGRDIGGFSPTDIRAGYDVLIQFKVLPKIPIVLLFNDRDSEFDAQARLLFEKRADRYLDAECLAILGNILFQTLKT